jgi:hypothetical protein
VRRVIIGACGERHGGRATSELGRYGRADAAHSQRRVVTMSPKAMYVMFRLVSPTRRWIFAGDINTLGAPRHRLQRLAGGGDAQLGCGRQPVGRTGCTPWVDVQKALECQHFRRRTERASLKVSTRLGTRRCDPTYRRVVAPLGWPGTGAAGRRPRVGGKEDADEQGTNRALLVLAEKRRECYDGRTKRGPALGNQGPFLSGMDRQPIILPALSG